MDTPVIDRIFQPLADRLSKAGVCIFAVARALLLASVCLAVVSILLDAWRTVSTLPSGLTLNVVFCAASIYMVSQIPWDVWKERRVMAEAGRRVLRAMMSGSPIINPMRARWSIRIGAWAAMCIFYPLMGWLFSQVMQDVVLTVSLCMFGASLPLALSGLYLGACQPQIPPARRTGVRSTGAASTILQTA
jgi:hypothetical protein